jgi:DNA-binding CsgD family transcriptional regulator
MSVEINPHVLALQPFLAQLLDAAETAQSLLSAEGQVLFSNAQARAIFAAGDGLTLDAGQQLNFAVPTDTQRWDEVLALGTGRFLIGRLSGAHPYRAHLFPLNGEELMTRAYRYLLVLHDPSNAPTHSIAAIQQLYRLTEAETEVLQALAAGKSVEEIAEQRGNAPATVRTQLKALYRKTRTSRQAELLRLVLPAA